MHASGGCAALIFLVENFHWSVIGMSCGQKAKANWEDRTPDLSLTKRLHCHCAKLATLPLHSLLVFFIVLFITKSIEVNVFLSRFETLNLLVSISLS